MSDFTPSNPSLTQAETEKSRAAKEHACPTVSSEKPSSFKNDPDDPTNPNEAIERSRRSVRRPFPDHPANSQK